MHLELDFQRFSSPTHSNCFVRLHPSVVHRLYHKALIVFTDSNGASNDSGRGWHITHEDENDVVFLPLKISFQSDQVGDTGVTTMYVSYNGGISSQGTS